MAKPIIAWSFSAVDMFENCPRKFWAVRIGKVVGDANQYNAAGQEDHKAFEAYLKGGVPLPNQYIQHQPLLDRFKQLPGERYVEYRMALDQNMVPCSPTAWNSAWVRANTDLTIVNGSEALTVDWKSGSARYPKEMQMEIAALLLFAHFPNVQRVKALFVYHNENAVKDYAYERAVMPQLWQPLLTVVKKMEHAVTSEQWPATPNKLCSYCPYAACPHNTNPDVK